jgi:Tol biopolymer transport system component
MGAVANPAVERGSAMSRLAERLSSVVCAAALLPAFGGPPVSAWSNAAHRAVSSVPGRHTIHTYFNVSPESPDGRFVLFYASAAADGQSGELVLQRRETGEETALARVVTTEDAHRAACQQWMDGGRTIVYHDCRDGRWTVLTVDLETRRERVLAVDRQLGFGAPSGTLVPLYGCHWKPGAHRDLELADLRTGALKTALRATDLVAREPAWVSKTFGCEASSLSVFFPVVSPDGRRVFFKLAKGSGEDSFRSSKAIQREGKFVCDLATGGLVRFYPEWGHPSWHPDSRRILEKGNRLLDPDAGTAKQLAPIPTDHPSFAPDGSQFVSDGKVTKDDYAATGNLVVTVGSASGDEQARVDLFKSTAGAKSWRKSHPHPVFSPDGRRLYYNVNEGPWTELRVAEPREAQARAQTPL